MRAASLGAGARRLEIYAIDDGARIRPTGQRVELVRGAHDMEIVRRR